MKKNTIISDIFDKISPEEKAKIDARVDAEIKWFDEHPDYNIRYGTDKSYWLEGIIAKGFNPIGITVMTCEETIIMETQDEIDKAWAIFKPKGWWYTVDQWKETREEYVKDIYEGIEADAPKVYWLDEKYSKLFG